MKTITFSAIKGGVGKSSLAALTACILAGSGKKVLCADADPQNSTTFYFKPEDKSPGKNLANVMAGRGADDNSVDTRVKGLRLVPSAPELLNCGNADFHVLKAALKKIEKNYDYCVIDTAPGFDGMTINCLLASDTVVTPAQFSNFDYKSALFYGEILKDMGLREKWRIVLNRLKSPKAGGSVYREYAAIYENAFGNVILESSVPESAAIRQFFDLGAKLSDAGKKARAFEALRNLARELTGERDLPNAV